MNETHAHGHKALSRAFATKNTLRLVAVTAGVFVLFFVLPLPTRAAFDWLYDFLSGGLFFLASQLGKLTIALFGILVQVAQYNDFVNADAVRIGWRVLRDLANMLFILVLLVIAFGTAFRIQQYRYTVLLRQLIIMAVLINFSKLITGFFIDLVQVIMMTFVNAFADTAAGNLTTALGLDKVLALRADVAGNEVSSLSIAGTLFLGVIMIAVSTIVTFLYVVIFLARIIFLWILIILSPLAYLFNTFPSTKRYWAEWWQKFWQYATIGPILAFFLWLTLTITASGTQQFTLIKTNLSNESTYDSGGPITGAISAIGSQAGILSFMVAVLLLIFSLKFATQSGVMGGAWAQSTFNNMKRGAPKMAKRLGLGAAGVVGATGGAALRSNRVAGLLARSKIPLVNTWGAKQQARNEAKRKAREEKRTEWVSGVKDQRTLERMINGTPRTKGAKEQQKAARKLAPALIRDHDDMVNQLQQMEPADIAKLPASQLADLSTRLDARGQKIHDVAPTFAESLLRTGSLQKMRASGYANQSGNRWNYDRATGRFTPPTDAAGNVIATPIDVTAVPSRDPASAKYDPNAYYTDLNEAKYEATRQAIRERFENNPEAFFRDAEFSLNQDRFLNREDFFEADAVVRDRERKLERGEARIEDLTGIKSAIQHGTKGEAANLAMDFAEGEAMGLMLGGAAGANLTGTQQRLAAGVLSEKYKHQEEEKEVEKRRQAMQADADREYQEKREEAARRGEIGAAGERREVTREEALAAVQADGTYQADLAKRAGTLRSALENAESINLINKARVGRSARGIIRHEEAHNAVSAMNDKEREALWQQLAPERQQEIEKFVRANWANGQAMSMRQVQEEFFTEVMATTGRSKRLGPLGLNMEDADKFTATQKMIDEKFGGNAGDFYKSDAYRNNTLAYLQRANYERAANEEEIMEGLAHASTLGKQERARALVRSLPGAGVANAWRMFSPERQQELYEKYADDERQAFLRRGKNYERFSETERAINKDYQGNAAAFYDSNEYRKNRKAFLSNEERSQALGEFTALQQEALGSMLAAYEGVEEEAPAEFAPDEQDLALLLHAAARKKAAPRMVAPVSVAEARPRIPKPPTVAAPAGSSRVTAAPPSRIVPRSFEAPISPIIQTNIINNTTVKSVASEFSKKIAGKIEELPRRSDLFYSLQQLQNVVVQVARTQGIEEKEVQGLTSEIDRLKAEVRSPAASSKDQEALRANIANLLRRFKTYETKEEEESDLTDVSASSV